MKKLGFVLVGLLILIVAAAMLVPLGMGFWLQSHANQVVKLAMVPRPGQLIPSLSTQKVSFHLKSFHRSWRSSTADYDVEIRRFAGDDFSDEKFPVQLTFQHGPLIKVEGSNNWRLAKVALTVHQSGVASGISGLHFFGWLGFDDHFTANFKAQNLVLHGSASSQFSSAKELTKMQGLSGHISAGLNSGQMSGHLAAEDILQTRPPFTMHARQMVYDYKMHSTSESILGVANMHAQQIDLGSLKQKISFKQPKNMISNYRKDGVDQLSFSGGIASLHFSPSIPLLTRKDLSTDVYGPMQYDFRASGKSLTKTLKKVSELLLPTINKKRPSAAVMSQVDALMQHLIADGVILDLHDLDIKSPLGPILLRFKVEFPPQSSQVPSYLMLLAQMKTSVDLTMSRVWFEEFAGQFYHRRAVQIDKLTGKPVPPTTAAQQQADQQIALWLHKGMLQKVPADKTVAADKTVTADKAGASSSADSQPKVKTTQQLYRVVVKYNQGRLTVNGRQLALFGSDPLSSLAPQKSSDTPKVSPRTSASTSPNASANTSPKVSPRTSASTSPRTSASASPNTSAISSEKTLPRAPVENKPKTVTPKATVSSSPASGAKQQTSATR